MTQRTQYHDATGREFLAKARAYLAEDDLLQARDAGHAIVDEAIERAVDGIILGTNYRRPLGEYKIGDAAQYVLKNAPCPVIVYRAPVEGSTP